MVNTIRRESSGPEAPSSRSEAKGSCVAKLACKLGHWAKESRDGMPGPARRWLSDSIDTIDSWWGGPALPHLFSASFRDVFNDVDDSACDSSCYRCIAL